MGAEVLIIPFLLIVMAAPGLLSRIQSTVLTSSHLLHSLNKLLLDTDSLCQAVLSQEAEWLSQMLQLCGQFCSLALSLLKHLPSLFTLLPQGFCQAELSLSAWKYGGVTSPEGDGEGIFVDKHCSTQFSEGYI